MMFVDGSRPSVHSGVKAALSLFSQLARWTVLCVFLTSLGMAPVSAQGSGKLPVRVVVVTTFEVGSDTGDTPGEFQAWVERLPLPQTLPFPLGNHPLRYNAAKQVLGIVTGEGSLRAAASIMALGLDDRFDLSKAYWVVA
ncbi:MAG TPA: hypothetical protein VME21_12585, partial [Steroidobacteraceae bacterium]|nr:hypothetical protein [Steroidobacteraceae bacterium]